MSQLSKRDQEKKQRRRLFQPHQLPIDYALCNCGPYLFRCGLQESDLSEQSQNFDRIGGCGEGSTIHPKASRFSQFASYCRR